MPDNPIPHLGAQFTDHVGRHYMEFPMPEDHAYEHPLKSYGEPRRLQVIDPNETRKFTIDKGYVHPSETGTQGLIGYTDFYREPMSKRGWISKHIHEDGSHTMVDETYNAADTNIGFMNVHPDHQQRGIASEMVNHLDRTTDPSSTINMGKAMHEATMNIVDNINEKNPGRAHMKVMFSRNPKKTAGVKRAGNG
jgi:GNAT superfamily N-acetyltransferase